MTTNITKERGQASILIELADGVITVTHGTDGVVLFKKGARVGDWDAIWKAIKEERGTYRVDADTDVDGTFYVGEFTADFHHIVDVFGTPDFTRQDGDKTDAQWTLMTPAGIATIYNWKDGKNYLGDDGTETVDIKEWHIGGRSRAVVGYVLEALHLDKPLHVVVK